MKPRIVNWRLEYRLHDKAPWESMNKYFTAYGDQVRLTVDFATCFREFVLRRTLQFRYGDARHIRMRNLTTGQIIQGSLRHIL